MDKNGLFNVDCLALLERLPSEAVTLAYLDPPWLSASDEQSHWASEADNSRAEDSANNLQRYLGFLGIRLQHVYRVLAAKGNIFVHSNPRITPYVRLLLDQIFGRHQFRTEIIIPLPFRRTGATVYREHPEIDYSTLLFYGKSDGSIYLPPVRILTNTEISTIYRHEDSKGKYRLLSLVRPLDRPALNYEWNGIRPQAGHSWIISKKRMEELEREGLIEFGLSSKIPARKVYYEESRSNNVSSIWNDLPVIIPTERVGFISQQPLVLLDRIIRMGSEEGDTILDPFAGSGTALIAAERAGRRWIGCDVSPEAYSIILERIETELQIESDSQFNVGAYESVQQDYPTKYSAPPLQSQGVQILQNRGSIRSTPDSYIAGRQDLIPIVFTEGKTDWKHLKAAYLRLKEERYYEENFDIEFHEYEDDSMGNKRLEEMCELYAARPRTRPHIFIFDRDDAKTTDNVMAGDRYKDWGNNVFSFVLPIPSHRSGCPDLSIEFYYKDEELQRKDSHGRRLFLNSEFDRTSGRHKTNLKLNSLAMNKIKSRSIKIIDQRVFDEKSNNVALSKNDFAENVLNRKGGFDELDVFEFTKVFDVIRDILGYDESLVLLLAT